MKNIAWLPRLPKHRLIPVLRAALICLPLAACLDDPGGDETLELLRIGMLSSHNQQRVRDRYKTLFKHLSVVSGLRYRLVLSDSTDGLTKLFRDKKIDLAYFPSLAYVRARQTHGAVPLVTQVSGRRFSSVFVVRTENSARSINDLKGARLSFGEKQSADGHLMPRKFLHNIGITAEKFFRGVTYSGGPAQAAYRVRDGKADIAVTNAKTIRYLYATGRLKKSEVRVLLQTPPFPDNVWAIRRQIKKGTRDRLRNAFLALTPEFVAGLEAVNPTVAPRFVPAHSGEFHRLVEVARRMNLL